MGKQKEKTCKINNYKIRCKKQVKQNLKQLNPLIKNQTARFALKINVHVI